MAAPLSRTAADAGTLARNLGANVYRYRVLIVPKPSQQALARVAGVADETLRSVEASRDPEHPPYNASLYVVERLAAGLRKLGVTVEALDLLATPSKRSGRRDHLRSIPGTGDALPRR